MTRDLFGTGRGFGAPLAASLAVGLLSLAVTLPATLPVVRWMASTMRLKILLATTKKKKNRTATDGNDDAAAPDDDDDGDGITVSGLFVHPVKSMRSVSLSESTLDRKGLTDDRRFMVVMELPLPSSKTKWEPGDTTHAFVSQRQCPSLATISAIVAARPKPGGERVLVLDRAASGSPIVLPIPSPERRSPSTHLAGLWDDVVAVDDLGDEAAAFLQAIVDADEDFSASGPADGDEAPEPKKLVRLVREAAPSEAPSYGRDTRGYVPGYAKTWTGGFLGKPTLTDGFPILIASEASLEALNAKLDEGGKKPIPMSRFRPNIVVKGGKPFEEDTWKVVVIGDTIFSIVKGCPRCKQACTDQTTGRVSPEMEPLKTMTSFRRSSGDKPKNGSVFFAQNAIPIGTLDGRRIRVGDRVRVLETGDPVFID